jgi:hypothetical protein
VSPHPLWKESRPSDTALKTPAGLTKPERAAEQDAAAGGRKAREMRLGKGRCAHASIALRVLRNGRRIYAYLRWSAGGKTYERYVGEVDSDSRAANLAQAWRIARQGGLFDTEHPGTSDS